MTFKYKKIIVTLFILGITIAITACGGGGQSNSSADTSTTPATAFANVNADGSLEPDTILIPSVDLQIRYFRNIFAKKINFKSYSKNGSLYYGYLNRDGSYLSYDGVTKFYIGDTYIGLTSKIEASLSDLDDFSSAICNDIDHTTVDYLLANNISSFNECSNFNSTILKNQSNSKKIKLIPNQAPIFSELYIQRLKDIDLEKAVAKLAFNIVTDAGVKISTHLKECSINEWCVADATKEERKFLQDNNCTYIKNGISNLLGYPGGHSGIDMYPVDPTKIFVYSIADGEIIKKDIDYGRVHVKHALTTNGKTEYFILSYLHLNPDDVSATQLGIIKKGVKIARWEGTGSKGQRDVFGRHLHLDVTPYVNVDSISVVAGMLGSRSGCGAALGSIKPRTDSYAILEQIINKPTTPTQTINSIKQLNSSYSNQMSKFEVVYTDNAIINKSYVFKYVNIAGEKFDCSYDYNTRLIICNIKVAGNYTVQAININTATVDKTIPFTTASDLSSFEVFTTPKCLQIQNNGIELLSSGFFNARNFNFRREFTIVQSNKPMVIQNQPVYGISLLSNIRYFPVLLNQGENEITVSSYNNENNTYTYKKFHHFVDSNFCSTNPTVTPSPVKISHLNTECPSKNVSLRYDNMPTARYYAFENNIPSHLGEYSNPLGDFAIFNYQALGKSLDLFVIGLDDSSPSIVGAGYSKINSRTCN